MEAPKTIAEYLNERIRFCETHLEATKNFPVNNLLMKSETDFTIALANYEELKRMLGLINNGQDHDGKIKLRFKDAMRKIIGEAVCLVSDQQKQEGGVLLSVKHDSEDISEGLLAVYTELWNM